jgi:Na+-translocating ferredoxin:NAD+ oxidoreductase RNF subunit RnfB
MILTAIVPRGDRAVARARAWRFRPLLAVEVDPRATAVRAALPGDNCGACGFRGATAPLRSCRGRGVAVCRRRQSAADAVARHGVAAGAAEKKVAVLCQGGETGSKYCHAGVGTAVAVLVAGAEGLPLPPSAFGNCTGLPSARSWSVDCIPVVDPAKRTGCGLCVAEPRAGDPPGPGRERYHILCSSHDKGPAVKKVCSVGCIACTLCVKNCPSKAIAIDHFLAVMDYAKCTHAGACRQKCPTGTIVCEVRPGEAPPAAPTLVASAAGAPPATVG